VRNHARDLAATRNYLTLDDVDAIQGLVAGEGPFMVVDLGAGSGTTALAVLDVRDDAQITTVDIDIANIHWAEKAVRAYYPNAAWDSLHMTAEAAASRFVGKPVSLVLHDAGHEFEDVYGDLVTWHAVVPSGTPLWVHDYTKAPWQEESYPGVRKALKDLIKRGLIVQAGTPGLGWTGRFQ